MIESKIYEGYTNKIKGKLYGLLCEREKNGEWEKFLDSIIIEVLDFEDRNKTINYLSLLNKLNSLKYLRYIYFRSTIFECMDLFEKLRKE